MALNHKYFKTLEQHDNASINYFMNKESKQLFYHKLALLSKNDYIRNKNKYSQSPNILTQKKTKLANQATARQPSHIGTPINLTIKQYEKKQKSLQNTHKFNENSLFKLPAINNKLKSYKNIDLRQQRPQKHINQIKQSFNLQQDIDDLNLSNKKFSPKAIKIKYYPIVVRTKAGSNGKMPKINQDMQIINQKLPFGIKLFCICDGHGTNGHFVVSFIKRKLLQYLNNRLINLSNMQYLQQQIYLSLQETNNKLLQSQINTQLSGATVVAVFIYEDKIMCFNVGDSRAILINDDHNIFKAQQISFDHKPDRSDQAKRIIANGGRIQQQIDQKMQAVGPLRVWMKDIRSPGLAMTRSFGDKAGIRAGTNAEPQVIQQLLKYQNKYLLIASDGVWQNLENHQVIKLIQKQLRQQQIQKAADKLLKKAINKWDDKFNSRDDITFVIVKLNSCKNNMQLS